MGIFSRGAVDDLAIVYNPTPKPVARSISDPFSSAFGGYISGGSDGSKWPGGLQSSGASATYNHYDLRANVRRAMQDSPPTRSIVTRRVDTIVDKGLFLQASPVEDVLGITRAEADAWAKKTQELFHLYMMSPDFSRNGRRNGYQKQRDISLYMERDNDFFVRLYYDQSNRDLISPLQVQDIDPNQIGYGGGHTSTDENISCVDAGIEYDSAGREIGYRVAVQADGGISEVRIPRRDRATGRLLMLHGYDSEYAGQSRGFSKIAHVIQDMQGFSDFSMSTIQKAINQAQYVATVESNSDNPASNPLSVAGINQLMVDNAEQMQDSIDDLSAQLQTTCIPEFTTRVPGSLVVTGLQGHQKLVPFKSTAPAESYNAFAASFMSFLTASTGTPPEVALLKFGENYSASRGALILFWRIAEIQRQILVYQYQQPVYEMWLAEEIARGRIVARGFQDATMRAAWCNAKWRGAAMPDIDPIKSLNATEKAIEIGLSNVEAEAFEHNGSDWDRNNAVNTAAYGAMPGKAPWKAGTVAAQTAEMDAAKASNGVDNDE